MAKYPEDILRGSAALKRAYDLAQGAELLAQKIDKKRELLEARAEEIEAKAREVELKAKKLDDDKKEVSDVLLQKEQQIKQAFDNWDTLTEEQFRTITKQLFKALVINEIKEAKGGL